MMISNCSWVPVGALNIMCNTRDSKYHWIRQDFEVASSRTCKGLKLAWFWSQKKKMWNVRTDVF